MAVLVAIATVIFAFTQLVHGHADNAGLGIIVGAVAGIFLWTMSNWVAKENA